MQPTRPEDTQAEIQGGKTPFPRGNSDASGTKGLGWQGVIGAQPLAKNVPVLSVATGERGVVVRAVIGGLIDVLVQRDEGPIVLYSEQDTDWLIDLDDPQGFTFALRSLMVAVVVERSHDLEYVAPEDPRHAYERAWRAAHAMWQDYGVVSGLLITDATKMTVAGALAEVRHAA